MKIEQDKLDKLVSLYNRHDFSNEDIKKMILNRSFPIDKIDMIEPNLENYFKKMSSLGYTKEQSNLLAIFYPNSIFCDFPKGKLHARYIKFLDNLKRENENSNYANLDCGTVREILELIDIPKDKIDIAFMYNLDIIFMDPKQLLKNIKFYLNCGMKREKLTFCATKMIQMLTYGEEEYKELIDELAFFGIDKLKFTKIIEIYAKRGAHMHVDDFISMLRVAKTKKLDYESFGKNLMKNLSVSKYSEKYFNDTYNNLKDLGFSETQTCYIISKATSVLAVSKELLEYKISILEGYLKLFIEDEDKVREEALRIISLWPVYFTLSPENLIDKLNVAHQHGLLLYIFEKPFNLIQSSELTDARGLYLKLYHPELDEKVFASLVYTSDKVFKDRFDISNDEVKKLMLNNS